MEIVCEIESAQPPTVVNTYQMVWVPGPATPGLKIPAELVPVPL